jgi:hypothetical protein
MVIVPIKPPKYVNLDQIGQQEKTVGHLQEVTKNYLIVIGGG